jgi:hypothetical protein
MLLHRACCRYAERAEEAPMTARPALIAVFAVVFFVLSAMLRQYREVTIPLTIVLAAWAGYAYFKRRSAA